MHQHAQLVIRSRYSCISRNAGVLWACSTLCDIVLNTEIIYCLLEMLQLVRYCSYWQLFCHVLQGGAADCREHGQQFSEGRSYSAVDVTEWNADFDVQSKHGIFLWFWGVFVTALASLRLVSPGAATDSVTLFFLTKKLTTFFQSSSSGTWWPV